jgi:hypothetical protein
LVIEKSIQTAIEKGSLPAPGTANPLFDHLLHARMADLPNSLNVLRTQACWIRHLNRPVQNIAIEIYAANKSQRVF